MHLATPSPSCRLLDGVSGIKTITKFNCADFPTRFAGQIDNFDVEGWVCLGTSMGLPHVAHEQCAQDMGHAETEHALVRSAANFCSQPPCEHAAGARAHRRGV